MKSILATSLISGAIVALLGNYAQAQSQIVPDNTLGAESSTVTPAASDSTVDNIQGGAIRETNLFHSFQEFNVGEGRSAYFLSPNTNIQNIFARVTGGNPSEILGTLGTRGGSSPNLFLINPNAIIFGQNASLNVGGSFVASTASSLKFADGTDFSAREPQTTPLLTVSVPIGLQFGGDAGRIVNQSVAVDSNDKSVGLQVQPGKTLALVGKDVTLDGGNLTAEAGRIELGSVDGSSLVSLTPIVQGWALGYEGVQNFRDIQLSQTALVNTGSEEKGGDIQVQGRRITLTDGSSIQAFTRGALSGGTVSVNASDAVELTGFVSAGSGFSYSNLQTNTFDTGSAGDLRIITRKLIVRDGAFVSTGTLGTGNGGNLDVNALESVELIGSDSSLVTRTERAGAAGNLTITTRKLIVGDGAQVTASTFGQGNGGELRVNATESVNLIGVGRNRFSSGLFASTRAEGQGGNITVDTGNLQVADGAVVSAITRSAGNAGNITVNANSVEAIRGGQIITATQGSGNAGNINLNTNNSLTLSGNDPTYPNRLARFGSNRINNVSPDSGLFANTAEGSTGNGGSVTLKTGQLNGSDGAELAVSSQGSGNAGNLQIQADSIRLENQGKLTAATASGEGGNITLQDLNLLLLRGNSEISTNAQGSGNGGNIDINTDLLTAGENSNITANAVKGRGGKIKIATQGLFLSPGSIIRAESEQGINGIVEINRPDIDPSADLVILPAQIINVSELVAQGCQAGGGNLARGTGEFVITGRGGLPPTPAEATRSDTTLADLGTPIQSKENRPRAEEPTNSTQELVEAQGWVINSQGEVILIANAPSVTPDIPWLTPTSCNQS